jgi:hypothetical protein
MLLRYEMRCRGRDKRGGNGKEDAGFFVSFYEGVGEYVRRRLLAGSFVEEWRPRLYTLLSRNLALRNSHVNDSVEGA